MTRGQADQWIIASAVVTGGIYAYLRYRGRAHAPVSVFTTAWGVVYVGLSVASVFAPGIAAGFALLVMTADLLANVPELAKEISAIENPTPAKGATR